MDIWKVLFQLFPCFIHSAVITIVVENALSDIKTDIWKVFKSFPFLIHSAAITIVVEAFGGEMLIKNLIPFWGIGSCESNVVFSS
jgi:hypothetical protein